MAGADGSVLPLVFSCAGCKALLSDSTELICSYEGLGYIVVAGGTNMEIRDESLRHPVDPSVGQALQICCRSCKASVGRLHESPLEGYPLATNRFCLDVTAMDSFQLGTGEVRACEKPPCAGHGNRFFNNTENLQQRIAGLEEDITKVQNMLLLHQERLEALEGEGQHS